MSFITKIETAKLPYALTDEVCTKGILTTAGSKMLQNFIPPYSATVYEKLEKEFGLCGKIAVGDFGVEKKSEAACALSCSDAEFVVSSVSVLENAGEFIAFKPTFGSVSRYGSCRSVATVDSFGIIAKKFDIIPKVLNIITGYDEKDALTLNIEYPNYESFTEYDIADITGYNLSECGEFKKALAVEYLISSVETSSNMGRYDGAKFGYASNNFSTWQELFQNTRAEGFSEPVKEQIMFGIYAISSGKYENFYKKAQIIRRQIVNRFKDILSNHEFAFGGLDIVPAVNLSGYPAAAVNNMVIVTDKLNEKKLLKITKMILEGGIKV